MFMKLGLAISDESEDLEDVDIQIIMVEGDAEKFKQTLSSLIDVIIESREKLQAIDNDLILSIGVIDEDSEE